MERKYPDANPPKKIYVPLPPETEKIGKLVLEAAYKVHTILFSLTEMSEPWPLKLEAF